MTSERYFGTLVRYIHRHPQHHGVVDDFRTYPYSSYQSLLTTQPTRLQRPTVLAWFGGTASFQTAHDIPLAEADVTTMVDVNFEIAF